MRREHPPTKYLPASANGCTARVCGRIAVATRFLLMMRVLARINVKLSGGATLPAETIPEMRGARTRLLAQCEFVHFLFLPWLRPCSLPDGRRRWIRSRWRQGAPRGPAIARRRFDSVIHVTRARGVTDGNEKASRT